MTIKKVHAVYFSATGTTRKTVLRIAGNIASALGTEWDEHDFTLPGARTAQLAFGPKDLMVFGSPVYAGRIPNVLLPYVKTIAGNGTLAVLTALFGNRAYDDALIEQRDIFMQNGFLPLAAGAFVGEHSFSTVLAAGRPDAKDMEIVDAFAAAATAAIRRIDAGEPPVPIEVKGNAGAGYYRPLDGNNKFIDIRKVKPVVLDGCTDCKLCAELCPMGSISRDDVREYTGICIKCGACVKNCPAHARDFVDPGYLFHKKELEERFSRRAEPELFVPAL